MRRWIGFACAAAVLCAAAWYFGRATIQPDSPTPVVAQAAPTEAPKEPPPKMIEVIDLARAYEPVREPEPVLPGGVDPASFIEEPMAPRRIPPAFDEENPFEDVIRDVQQTQGGTLGAEVLYSERIAVRPRQVMLLVDDIRNRVCQTPVLVNGELAFVPANPSFPPRVIDIEELNVLPRVVQPIDDPGSWGIGSGPVQNLLYTPEFPYPVYFEVIPREVITLWLQITELYGFVGVDAER